MVENQWPRLFRDSKIIYKIYMLDNNNKCNANDYNFTFKKIVFWILISTCDFQALRSYISFTRELVSVSNFNIVIDFLNIFLK